MVRDPFDLAELGQDFLNLVGVLVKHLDDLVNDLTLSVRAREKLIEDSLVALSACLEVLKTFLGPREDSLDKNGSVLDDLKELLA